MAILKKTFIIFLAVNIFVFSTFIIPEKKAEAAAFVGAVPAGITVGAGAYTLAALGLAGLVGAVGYAENADAINAHALRAWENGTDLAKTSLNWSIDQSVALGDAAGTTLTNLSDGFTNWVNDFGLDAMLYALQSADTYDDLYKNFGGSVGRDLEGKVEAWSASGVLTNGDYWLLNGVKYNDLVLSLNPRSYDKITIRSRNTTLYSDHSFSTNSIFTLAAATYDKGISISTYESVANMIQGVNLTYNNNEFMTSTAANQVREAWRDMTDAGLVLPVNDAVPSVNGQNLTYNPATDTYTFPSGTTYDGSLENLDWAFPVPQVVPDILTGQDVVAYPSTGVGTGVGTGDVTWTDVFTGNPVKTDSTPIEGEVPPVTPPAPDLSRPTKGLSFLPLMMVGDLLKAKFPFSIPFDFFKQLSIFDVAPEAPIIKINEQISMLDMTIPFKFDIDLTLFDKAANIIRWGNIILFDIGLILMIRRLLPE